MRNRQNGLNGRSDSASVRGKAMSSPAAELVYGKHGGYRNLKAYQVAELLYDFTCRFCARYILKSNRHHDQMVQAARSGYQNIAEGSEDSATSKKLEMNLTNVARSSLDEARKDYIKHLMRRGLSHWPESAPSFSEARSLRPQTVEEAAAWVNRPGAGEPVEERAANLGAILAAQAHWLAERLLDRHARDFEKDGGFSERLYRARAGKSSHSVPSVSSVVHNRTAAGTDRISDLPSEAGWAKHGERKPGKIYCPQQAHKTENRSLTIR